MPVLGVALFCDVFAFALACGAVARRSKVRSSFPASCVLEFFSFGFGSVSLAILNERRVSVLPPFALVLRLRRIVRKCDLYVKRIGLS
jgi:hypothetical protein